MQLLINTVYVLHLQNIIADSPTKIGRATVKGKLNKLCNANILLRCAIFTHILTPAKNSSLDTQKYDAFDVDIFDMAETMCTYHVKMVEKLKKTPDSVFELLTLKSIITDIEEKNSKDGEPVYQNYFVESYIEQI